MIARLALSLFLLLPGGCIALYIPDGSRAATRGRIDKEELRPMTIGGTTRQEILSTFGEPDLVSEDGDAIVYWWYKSRGFAMVGTLGGGGAGMAGRRIYVCFKFDKESKVLRHKIVETSGGELSDEKAAEAARVLSEW